MVIFLRLTLSKLNNHPEPSMLGIDSSLLGGGPPPMPFDPAVLEKQRMNSYDTKETFTPADLFVARQSDVLRKYYEMMVDQVKAIGGPTEAGQQPGIQFNRK